jgi:hypothetical protein
MCWTHYSVDSVSANDIQAGLFADKLRVTPMPACAPRKLLVGVSRETPIL